jgi:hypothetical protein
VKITDRIAAFYLERKMGKKPSALENKGLSASEHIF